MRSETINFNANAIWIKGARFLTLMNIALRNGLKNIKRDGNKEKEVGQ